MSEILRLLRSRLTSSRLVRAAYFDALVPLARRSPFPSHVMGPVKHVHDSVADWLAGDARRGTFEVLEPATEIEYPAPALSVPERPLHFALNARQQIPQQLVARIRDGRVAYPSFDVVSPDDGVFADLLFGASTDGVDRAKSLNSLRMPMLRKRDGNYALIVTNRANNYYHWINDCLTRLRALELAGLEKRRLLVPAQLNRYQRESLALLGFGESDLAPFGNDYWSVEELVVPSLASAPQHSNPAACKWLRRRCLAPVKCYSADAPKRVYISRAGATKRRLLNEDEVTRYLKGKGFQVTQTELLTLSEQIALAHSAELIVAPHGAGLTNALFMREGATVIELLPAKRAKPCFYSLSVAVGIRYACVTNAVEGEAPAASFAREADFQVPVDRVAAAIEWAIR